MEVKSLLSTKLFVYMSLNMLHAACYCAVNFGGKTKPKQTKKAEQAILQLLSSELEINAENRHCL